MAQGTKPERWFIPEPVRRRMIQVARTLRRNATPTEMTLWQPLRGQKRGYKVRRQQPVGPLSLDFYVPSARLAVEIDGPVHQRQKDNDEARQACLEQLGLRFLRIPTQAVEQDLAAVLRQIDQVVAERAAAGREQGR